MQLNGVTIATPQRFNIETFDIARETRLASGKLVRDIVATKKRFSLGYMDLTGIALNTILTQLYSADFVTLEYPTETGTATATVTRGEVPRELWDNSGSKRYRDITFTLVEQ